MPFSFFNLPASLILMMVAVLALAQVSGYIKSQRR